MAKKDIIDILMEELELWEKEKAKKSYSHKPHLASLPHDRRTNDPELLQERIDAIDERMADNLKKMDDLRNKINDTIERRDKFQKTVDEIQKICDKQEENNRKVDEYRAKRKKENEGVRKELRDAYKELSSNSLLDTAPSTNEGYDIDDVFDKYFGADNPIANIYSGIVTTHSVDDMLELADQIDEQWAYFDSGYSDKADEYMGEVHDFTDNIRDYANSVNCTNDQGWKELIKEQNEIDPDWWREGTAKSQEDRLKLIDSNNLIINECDEEIIRDTRTLNKLGREQKDYADERSKCVDKQKEVK